MLVSASDEVVMLIAYWQDKRSSWGISNSSRSDRDMRQVVLFRIWEQLNEIDGGKEQNV